MDAHIAAKSQIIVSIIIPCYNSGEFLPDALNSVLSYERLEILEIIIVDDGSTDVLTLDLLAKAELKGCRVFYQPNKGPAAARNTGIAEAIGKYILFLDSDNKIKHSYIEKGIIALDSDSEVGVVYGKPSFFGDTDIARFETYTFDSYKILLSNSVDMCTMIRKNMWMEVGGLDENRILIGHEDWEFWIRITSAGWKFVFIDEVLFEYRVRVDSLITSATKPEAAERLLKYIHHKHYSEYHRMYDKLYKEYCAYEYDKSNPVRSFFKFMYLKYFSRK